MSKKFSIFHIPYSIEFNKLKNFQVKWQMGRTKEAACLTGVDNGKWQIPRGFTLIEILVVISIIAIISTFTFANLMVGRERARDAQRKSDLRQLQASFELYRADQGSYPDALPPCGTALTADGNTYIQKVPCDPQNDGQHVYTLVSSGSMYELIACLENVNDAQKDAQNNAAYCSGDTSNWSYTLTNP